MIRSGTFNFGAGRPRRVLPQPRRRSVLSNQAPRLVAATLATILATGVLAIVPTSVASAANQTVTNCNDGGAGSLRAAVANANSGDTVTFSVTCPPGSPIALTSGPIDITTSLTIAGPGASQLAVSGNGDSQVFNVASGNTVTISGITVENGHNNTSIDNNFSGGGIENHGTLTLSNATVLNNTVIEVCDSSCNTFGGGIENDSGASLTVDHSLITDNKAEVKCTLICSASGGGIANLSGGSLTVTDSTISGNTANDNFSGLATNNDGSEADGAGIDNAGTATIDASTVADNTVTTSCEESCASNGGGIDNEVDGTLTLHNSTLTDNQVSTGCVTACGEFGGGFYNDGSGATITNTTLSGNTEFRGCNSVCGGGGGGIYNLTEYSIGASIVANSTTADDCDGKFPIDLGYNLDDDGTCGFTAANHDLSDTPAGLDPAGLQDNGGPTQTIELQATSAAVDHVADPNLCPPTDQRGSPRLVPCDIGAYDTDGPVLDGSQIHTVIQVETSPSYANDPVHIDSSQLQAACGGTITFETLQGATARNPKTSTNSITVILDDDGNVSVVVDGSNCAPGSDVVEADLTVAPFLTALTTLQVEPPAVTPEGVSAYPTNEVETGNTPGSGDSNVYTVFYVETSPVYAEQQVEISSPQLESRCVEGWRFEPGVGAPINQASGTTKAVGTLDDDGNAVFVFKGISCATGPSAVIADVLAGSHPTYVTTYTVASPAVTLAGSMQASVEATPVGKAAKKAARQARKALRKQRRQGQGATPGSGTGSAPPTMTVDANPNPLIETGIAQTGGPPVLSITKTDDRGGSSVTNAVGNDSPGDPITYTITVSNTGSSEVDNVKVTDPLSSNPAIDSDSWTATKTGDASGFSFSGNGDINDVVQLPPGSSVTYTVVVEVTCTLFAGQLTLSNTATAASLVTTVTATDSDTAGTNSCDR
jgi:uncharacterized repeat protein (TIGR01451 family)